MPQSAIDLEDAPEATGEFRPDLRGTQTLFKPIKQQITLRIDGDVLAWAKRAGAGYQSRINAALRKAMMEEVNLNRKKA